MISIDDEEKQQIETSTMTSEYQYMVTHCYYCKRMYPDQDEAQGNASCCRCNSFLLFYACLLAYWRPWLVLFLDFSLVVYTFTMSVCADAIVRICGEFPGFAIGTSFTLGWFFMVLAFLDRVLCITVCTLLGCTLLTGHWDWIWMFIEAVITG